MQSPLQSESFGERTEAVKAHFQVPVGPGIGTFRVACEDKVLALRVLPLEHDQSSFGGDYEALVKQALGTTDPEARLQFAARIARQIHESQIATFDLLRGAGVVAPELAKLEQRRECVRYERQESTMILLRDSRRLRPELDYQTARDVFWMFTGRDVYRMLARERGWTPHKYEDWLAETLIKNLLTRGRASRERQRY